MDTETNVEAETVVLAVRDLERPLGMLEGMSVLLSEWSVLAFEASLGSGERQWQAITWLADEMESATESLRNRYEILVLAVDCPEPQAPPVPERARSIWERLDGVGDELAAEEPVPAHPGPHLELLIHERMCQVERDLTWLRQAVGGTAGC